MFQNDAAEFVYMRTYSRWIDEEKRRETWPETVARYIKFIKEQRPNVPAKVLRKIQSQMLNFGVLPSMRLLWAAGPAAARDNTCIYNCSYLDINDLDCFGEALFILMCGTGVGFGVTKVEQLPDVPVFDPLTMRYLPITITDSKEGWADSVKLLLHTLYSGNSVDFDYSQIRPRGSRLNVFGGRASGPEPLVKLHAYIKDTVGQAQGRKLTALEVHDIMCEIAEIVVVGGVRRSSLISLSKLDDTEMRASKVWPFPIRRAMANNSAVYESKPTAVEFLREWQALIESGSGERGIFNLNAVRKSAPARRDSAQVRGTNPCKPLKSLILTPEGYITFAQALTRKSLRVVTPSGIKKATAPFLTGESQPVFRVGLSNGYSIYGTSNHRHLNTKGDWVEIQDLNVGDELPFLVRPVYDDTDIDTKSTEYTDGLWCGWVHGDGSWFKRSDSSGDTVSVCFGDKKQEVADLFESLFDFKTKPHQQKPDTCRVFSTHNSKYAKILINHGVDRDKNKLDWIYGKTKEFKIGFIRALFTADGSVRDKSGTVELYSTRNNVLETIGHLLHEFGIYSAITTHSKAKSYIAKDGKQRNNQITYKLCVHGTDYQRIGFLTSYHTNRLGICARPRKLKPRVVVKEIVLHSTEDVYDITVHDDQHAFIDSGIISHNCGEIALRSKQFCNLSTVIVRPEDDIDSLLDKVETAAWMGTIQASFTHFPYLRPEWKQNCEEEALLGVSLSGQMDNTQLLDRAVLKAAKNKAIKVNARAAEILSINPAAAITCGKPEGTTSQFTVSGSGCHPWYSNFFIRRYRINSSDPLYRMMCDQGFKFSPENGQTEENATTWVVSFPCKAPTNAITRHDMDAMEQLHWYQHIQDNWCEHNQSITVYVKDDEWLKVGNWVYENWDTVNGVSFLPYDNGKYQQAPYEEITEEQYEAMKASIPTIDYTQLSNYEIDDNTEGAKSYACVSGKCDLV